MGAKTTSRVARRRRRPLLGSFSIFLLGFGLCFWLVFFFTNNTAAGICGFAVIWLSGWFEGRSLLQLFGFAILAIALLFLVRTAALGLWRTRTIETLMQAAFVAGLVFACGGLKALLLPFGFPPQAFYEKASAAIFGPLRASLSEEASLNREWLYDYPAPPPSPREIKDPSYAEMFPHADSPLWSELKAAEQCRVDGVAAVKAYRDWEKGFDEHMKKEGWRYYQ